MKNLLLIILSLSGIAFAEDATPEVDIGSNIPSLYNPIVSRGKNFNFSDNIDTDPAKLTDTFDEGQSHQGQSNGRVKKKSKPLLDANGKPFLTSDQIWDGFDGKDVDDYNRRYELADRQNKQQMLMEQEARKPESEALVENVRALMNESVGATNNITTSDMERAAQGLTGVDAIEAMFNEGMRANDEAAMRASQVINGF